MAKKNKTETGTVNPSPVTLPEGFEEATSDLDSFWDYAGEIRVIPLGYTLSDPKDKKKPSILIHCELAADREMTNAEGETVMFHQGARVGVWYKPGLKELMNFGGVTTFLAFKDEIDVGQIQPMKRYYVAGPKGARGKRLQCLGDYRKATRNMALPWEDADSAPKARKSAEPADNSDLPF